MMKAKTVGLRHLRQQHQPTPMTIPLFVGDKACDLVGLLERAVVALEKIEERMREHSKGIQSAETALCSEIRSVTRALGGACESGVKLPKKASAAKSLRMTDKLASLFGVDPASHVSRECVKSMMFKYVRDHQLYQVDSKQQFSPNDAMLEVFPDLKPTDSLKVFQFQSQLYAQLRPIKEVVAATTHKKKKGPSTPVEPSETVLGTVIKRVRKIKRAVPDSPGSSLESPSIATAAAAAAAAAVERPLKKAKPLHAVAKTATNPSPTAIKPPKKRKERHAESHAEHSHDDEEEEVAESPPVQANAPKRKKSEKRAQK
jgi:hypothetical protein